MLYDDFDVCDYLQLRAMKLYRTQCNLYLKNGLLYKKIFVGKMWKDNR